MQTSVPRSRQSYHCYHLLLPLGADLMLCCTQSFQPCVIFQCTEPIWQLHICSRNRNLSPVPEAISFQPSPLWEYPFPNLIYTDCSCPSFNIPGGLRALALFVIFDAVQPAALLGDTHFPPLHTFYRQGYHFLLPQWVPPGIPAAQNLESCSLLQELGPSWGLWFAKYTCASGRDRALWYLTSSPSWSSLTTQQKQLKNKSQSWLFSLLNKPRKDCSQDQSNAHERENAESWKGWESTPFNSKLLTVSVLLQLKLHILLSAAKAATAVNSATQR